MLCDYKQILDNLSLPIFVAELIKDSNNTAIDFKICYKNQTMSEKFDALFKEGSKYSEFKNKLSSSLAWDKILFTAANEKTTKEHTFFSRESETWFKFCAKYIENDFIICYFSDITTEMNYTAHLKEAFIKDSTTELTNKVGFFDDLDLVYETCKSNNSYFALFLFIIDDMKDLFESQDINKKDSVISKSANILKHFERELIKVYRYSDEEFAVLICNVDSIDSIFTITDTIFEAFQMQNIHISGGVSVYPYNTEQKDELINFANMAIHHSLENGKNQINYFDTSMQRRFLQRLTLQTKMATAISQNNFKQFYQPQFDIKSGELRGFEALIRWHDNELGSISPADFIPLAEETNLIVPIGQWVLETALKTLKNWQEKYEFNGIISINVSPLQLRQDDFLPNLEQLLKKYEINPTTVEVEVTEGVFIDNMQETIEKLQKIKSMGIRISLDDFGTGYSSLSYLQSLPLDTLKIDKSFINDICASDGVQANITSSIINMVSKMGLETIAEGVENENQLKLLDKFNCNVVQGFYRGKPMPLERCNSYLSGDKNAILKN